MCGFWCGLEREGVGGSGGVFEGGGVRRGGVMVGWGFGKNEFRWWVGVVEGVRL